MSSRRSINDSTEEVAGQSPRATTKTFSRGSVSTLYNRYVRRWLLCSLRSHPNLLNSSYNACFVLFIGRRESDLSTSYIYILSETHEPVQQLLAPLIYSESTRLPRYHRWTLRQQIMSPDGCIDHVKPVQSRDRTKSVDTKYRDVHFAKTSASS